jgi:hypothetical protein
MQIELMLRERERGRERERETEYLVLTCVRVGRGYCRYNIFRRNE